MKNSKQSVLLGGLISSAGIFISKFLGLLYVVPFNNILGTAANRMYYSQAYNIYSYILNIATAGLPFAIATLVARYVSREDYKTCLLVKKISFYTMAIFGFICMVLVMLLSGVIASSICPDNGDVAIMKTVIIMISLALFIVPILSSLRGFIQGLKEMEIYSTSQVLEQVVRILFLLSFGAIAVYVLKKDNIWALYFGVMSASIAGGCTILYVRARANNAYKYVKEQAQIQSIVPKDSAAVIFKELIIVAVPFLISAMFGYSDTIINQFDLKPGLENFGMAYTDALSDAIFYKSTKIIAIPMILAPGFSAAIIPYITTAMEQKNVKLVRKYIIDCVESVYYIAIPICFSIFAFSTAVIFVLFGNEELELNSMVLKWYALEAFMATVSPIGASICMAIGFRKESIINSGVFAVVKLALNRLLISYVGIGGCILSSFIAYIVFNIINFYLIQKKYHVRWKYSIRKLFICLIGLLAYYGVFMIFHMFGLDTYDTSRVLCLFLLGGMGIATCGAYFVITSVCSVPQTIFHFTFSGILARFKR